VAKKLNTAQMDVFTLRDAIVDDYKSFATSFTKIAAEDIKRKVTGIFADGRYWPDPYLQINPAYRQRCNVGDLVGSGQLHPGCAEIFRDELGAPRDLYAHQEAAIDLANQDASYVVTSGTGSGKSLCYFVPIINQLLREREKSDSPRCTRAIVIYPMNALVNSQLEEVERYLRRGTSQSSLSIKVAKFTGDDSQGQRDKIRSEVPDILLTNFMMLEMLMTRQDDLDQEVMRHCDLRYLVLDELHTYRGRQGADVALLARRVSQKLRKDLNAPFQCIGTSATMSSDNSTDADKIIAKVAHTIFGVPVSPSNVIREQLQRRTNPGEDAVSVVPRLGQAIDSRVSVDLTHEELQNHPLAIWIETTLGIEQRELVGWARKQPITLKEAAKKLGKAAQRPVELCEEALQNFLSVASVPRSLPGKEIKRAFFAFKLHQFLSGAKSLYVTLEPPGQRTVTVEGALLARDGVRLYPTAFCRECGQAYHAVNHTEAHGFLPRELDDAPIEVQEEESLLTAGRKKRGNSRPNFGFLLMADNPDIQWVPPDSWLETTNKGERVTASKQVLVPEEVHVTPAGECSAVGGRRAFFMPGKFRICLACGHEYAARGRDATVLATLSAEGRTSATSIVTARTLRFMHEPRANVLINKRKLLAFTDNRQDAALQAGHFNDFAFVTRFRSAVLAALQDTPAGLMELACRATEALGFAKTNEELRPYWINEPVWRGRRLDEAHRVFEETMALRILQDLRNIWRYTNPNLLRLKLLLVNYDGLGDLVKDQRAFAGLPTEYGAVMAQSDVATRERLLREMLGALLSGFAVDSDQYGYQQLRKLGDEACHKLQEPWKLHRDETELSATVLATRMPSDAKALERRELLSGGPRSQLGRKLLKFFPGISPKNKGDDLPAFVDALMDAARTYGIIKQSFAKNDARGWQLDIGCLQFSRGPGDPDRASYGPYFTALYRDCAKLLRQPEHPLFLLEAREHTAQIDSATRKHREERFKFTDEARANLLRESASTKPTPLPLLFCSPTMELGVDISDLDVVYLRNVPPTPANYAQRGGRAGRSGQAALVITYCSAHSPHDQHFFSAPSRMVHGEVRPPILDLTNQQLVRSHGQAVWLAATGQKLGAFPADAVDLEDKPAYALKAEIGAAFAADPEKSLGAVIQFLTALDPVLKNGKASWYMGPQALAADIANNAAAAFDQALTRWRNLVTCAEKQVEDASRALSNHALSPKEQGYHRKVRESAEEQLQLLMPKGRAGFSNDFYIYRYLATEGFLPGYNFPRLPLFAFVPGQPGSTRRGQTYIARAKFLAISEFGPHSLIYHDGQAYRVSRAIIKMAKDASAGASISGVRDWRLCDACGYGIAEAEASVCPNCTAALESKGILRLNRVMPLENVGTEPRLRITANDENRSRRGFDLQTTYSWAKRHDRLDVHKVRVTSKEGYPVVDLDYGAAAELTRFNKGLKRRMPESGLGFNMEPLTGRWLNNDVDDEDSGETGKIVSSFQRVIPAVQENKNALIFRPRFSEREAITAATLPTIQHALVRAVHRCFELEEGEILAEPLPNEKDRACYLLYEATEGGAGVLNRLAPTPTADDTDPLEDLRRVGAKALSLLHVGGSDGAECVAGCYRCLLSYYNQTDHPRLDRRDPAALAFFERLTQVDRATAVDGTVQRILEKLTTALPPIVSTWKERARVNKVPDPDRAPLIFQHFSLPLVWNVHRVVALLESNAALSRALESRGYAVVQFNVAASDSWDSDFSTLLQALGKAP
jgi:hypothetical protein